MGFLAFQALKLVALWTHLWHTLPNALKSARKQPTSQTANPTTVDQDLVKTQNTGPPLRGLLGGNLLASSWVRNIQKNYGTESSSVCNCRLNSEFSWLSMAYQALELAQAWVVVHLEQEKQTLSQKKCVGKMTMEEEIKQNILQQ